MGNKKVLVIVLGIILVVIIAIFAIVNVVTKKDREYEIIVEKELNYWLLNIDEHYGVIDKTGKIIIEPEYDRIDIPNRDKAIFVTYKEDLKNIVNEKNESIYKDIDVSAIEIIDENDEENTFDTSRLKYVENGKYGLLDFSGKKITEAKYDEIISLTDKYGEYRVKKDNKYGVLSNKGVELVDIKYDYVAGDGYSVDGSYKEAGYIVGKKTDDGILYGYIDKNEKEILKMENENVYRVLDMPGSELYLVVTQNGRSQIFKDKKNKTDYLYREVRYSVHSNMFVVQKNKTYGLLDKDFNVIIEPKYNELLVAGIYVNASIGEEMYVFDLNGKEIKNSEYIGLEKTSTEKYYIAIDKENYMYGVLNEDMEVVLEPTYDYIREVENTDLIVATKGDSITIFSANMKKLVSVNNASMDIVNNHIKILTDDSTEYFTMSGKQVDNMTVYLKNEIYADKKNGKWGFVDLEGNVVVKHQYDKVTEVNSYGFAGIYSNGKWGVIDGKGNIVLKPKYKSETEEPSFIGEYYIDGNECTNIIY